VWRGSNSFSTESIRHVECAEYLTALALQGNWCHQLESDVVSSVGFIPFKIAVASLLVTLFNRLHHFFVLPREWSDQSVICEPLLGALCFLIKIELHAQIVENLIHLEEFGWARHFLGQVNVYLRWGEVESRLLERLELLHGQKVGSHILREVHIDNYVAIIAL